MNCIVIVGSSISSSGKMVGRAISVMVSPTLRSAMPVMAQMSPAAASASSNRLSDWIAEHLLRRGTPRACRRDGRSSTRSPDLDPARVDAADGDVAEVVVVVERRDLHAEGAVDVAGGRRHVLDDQVEQRRRDPSCASVRLLTAQPSRPEA